jgi:hypothetical protein
MRTAGLKGTAVALSFALVAGLTGCGDAADTEGAEGGAAAVDTLAQRAQELDALTLAALAEDDEPHIGHEVRIANAPVDSRMGQRGIWLKLPNQGLYLVRATAEQAGSVQPGGRVTVAGPIREMTDSVVTAWLAEGAITADEEGQARYATTYLDAWYVSTGQQATAGAAQN